MFASWGSIVYRARFTVIAAMVAGMLGLAAYGLDLEDHLSQSGWFDPGSESVTASKLARIAPVSREMVLNFVAQTSLGLPRSY